MTGVPNEESGRHFQALEADLKSLLEGNGCVGVKILLSEESKGIEIPRDGESIVRNGNGVLSLLHNDSGVSAWDGRSYV